MFDRIAQLRPGRFDYRVMALGTRPGRFIWLCLFWTASG
jgi:hypothetical protein